jgi:hypothetical protein
LYKLLSGLTYPMPKVVGRNKAQAQRMLDTLMEDDDVRREIRGTNLVIADEFGLPLPENDYEPTSAAFADPMVKTIIMDPKHQTTPRVYTHELGHIRQGRLGLPVVNNEEADYLSEERMKRFIADRGRGTDRNYSPPPVPNEPRSSRHPHPDINLPLEKKLIERELEARKLLRRYRDVGP